VELAILGAHGTWPGAGAETCGYLVTEGDFHLWLDAGTGTFARLQEIIPVDRVGAMLISHGHPDHFVDMIPAFYARHYGGLGDPGLPFFSPEGFTDLAALLVSENGRNVMSEAFAFRTLVDRDEFEIGPFHVTAFRMVHIGVEALGYCIKSASGTLAYTGDTGPCDAAIQLANGADLFLSEATYQNSSTLMPFHLSAAQAGEIATEAGVKHLVLTHLTPDLDPVISLREAAATFQGAIDMAVRGMVLEVGR
jgi:ribonuclease BN (tRNA processing enzyme)